MIQKESKHGLLKIEAGLRIADTVTFLGEDLQLVGFLCLDQRLNQLRRVAKVHIFINHAMNYH